MRPREREPGTRRLPTPGLAARRLAARRLAALFSLLAALLTPAGCGAPVVEPELPPAWSPAQAAAPLTRAECVHLAANSAPSAAAWEARRAAAKANLEQAGLLANPTLSLAWEDFGLNHAAEGSALQTTVSLAVALEDVFSRGSREAAARHELEAEEADIRAERARLAADVAHAYDELVAARARVELQQDLVAEARTQRDDVARFVASGDSPRIEQDRAEAELAAAQADAARARTEARGQELGFAFALGFERPVTLQLAEPLTGEGPSLDPTAGSGTGAGPGAGPAAIEIDLAGLLAVAADARPELAAAAARYAAQLERLSLVAERPQFLPTLGAGPRWQKDELRGVGTIDVALPIFDSGAAAQRGEQAALLGAAAALRAAARDVAREVCAARERLEAAVTYLDGHARDLADRRHALNLSTTRLFRAGEVAYTELALARRDDVEAQLALLEARLAVAAARVDLAAAIGRLDDNAPDPATGTP